MPRSITELLRVKRIYLFDDIDEHMVRKVANEIYESVDDPTPITILISSRGGAMWAGRTIGILARTAPMDVDVVNVGACWSSAMDIIAMARHGHRYALAGTSFFIHHTNIDIDRDSQNVFDMQDRLWMLSTADDVVTKTLSELTGITEDTIREMANANGGRGTNLSAEEALRLGIIDYIIPID